MTKTKTYAQLKAKKAWLLHKPSTKKPRCRPPNKPRENKNMATDAMEKRTSLPSTSGDKEKAESGTVCSLLGGSPHHDEDSPALALAAPRSEDIKRKRRFYSPVVESFYNFMAFGYQGLKGIGITFYNTAEGLLPGRGYKRKLDEVNERLDGLESEVKRLKLELSSSKVGHCHHHQLSVSHSIPAETSGALAPPPPPPPPPPIAPPPPVFTVVKNRQKTSNKAKAPAVQKRAIVTVEDLLSVKLRSTSTSSKSQVAECDSVSHDKLDIQSRAPLTQLSTNHSSSRMQPVISLKDIQNVSLRKLHLDIEAAKKFNASSPESTTCFTRRNLRRVNIDRSPGGTPLAVERQESTGTGLTPMITRALKRKFQLANPPSPTSPSSRGTIKNLSPLVSPLSPLSL